MSSFICNAKHFNSIEQSVKLLTYGSEFYFPFSFKADFPELYEIRTSSFDKLDKSIEKIIDTLRELNSVCVTLQYAHHYKGKVDEQIKTETTYLLKHKKEAITLDHTGLYKALTCLDYQIEEEHLQDIRALTPDETKALKFLKLMIDALAHHIVSKSDSYEAAKWEIS